MSIVGTGAHTYRIEDWPQLPGRPPLPDVVAIGIDKDERLYVFNRGDEPMLVFDRTGNFITSWGLGRFRRPHGLHLGPDETIYCSDDSDHGVRKFTLQGELLLEIGVPRSSACDGGDRSSHRCTHVATSRHNSIFVADGCCDRIHKYSADGMMLASWGAPGSAPGQFRLPHSVCCDAEGSVYVADRDNDRVQVFAADGTFRAQWSNLHHPSALFIASDPEQLCYVGELQPPRITVLRRDGRMVAQLASDAFTAPHCVAVDSLGDIYVGQVRASPRPLLKLKKF
ncbi:MAG: hypothetical protein QOF71_1970 [Candidatus Eremiobacteraeota bacterium]|jgi:DNA-binding beta-propeller fold protein YncE|nr:hypothetical protein [Candidatus Eremiobacteraeota bacterium]